MGPAPGREPHEEGAHEHDLRLLAVHLDDGSSTREFGCTTCGAAWFD